MTSASECHVPNRSAILPKNSRNAPLLKDVAEDIQVISAVDMLRSLPTNDEMTVTDPVDKEPIAMAIVAVRTKRTSWVVDLKHAGRALLVCTGSMGCRSFDCGNGSDVVDVRWVSARVRSFS